MTFLVTSYYVFYAKKYNVLVVNLEVSDLSDSNIIQLPNVFSSPSLPVSADTIGNQEDVNRWPHLKGIKIHSIRAGLLIGSDVPSILQPRESRESKDGGLVLACTIFGWVLNGALGGKEPKDPTVNFVDANATLSKQF